MKPIKSERLRKLEAELRDLEQWLQLGLVPKKDVERHQEEIRLLQAKIEEEKERLQFLKEGGEGEEFIVVVTGEVELEYGGAVQILKPGDSAYYNSVVQHLVKSANGQPAKIYAVVYMPF